MIALPWISRLVLAFSATAALLSQVAVVRADGEHRVIAGIATTCADITTWWHGDPTGFGSRTVYRALHGSASARVPL